MGDPECQVILPRLKTDLLKIIKFSINNNLKKINIKWSKEKSMTIVLCSKGYPGKYKRNSIITDMDDIPLDEDSYIYHSGTGTNQQGQIIAKGGRVLSVTAKAKNYKEARLKAYKTVTKIKWDNGFYRTDIAKY